MKLNSLSQAVWCGSALFLSMSVGSLVSRAEASSCWLKTYRYEDASGYTQAQRFHLDSESVQTLTSGQFETPSGPVFSILIPGSSNQGLFYSKKSNRDEDLHALQVSNISNSKISKEFCSEEQNESDRMGASGSTASSSASEVSASRSVPLGSTLFIKDSTEVKAERLQKRMERVAANQGRLPGPKLPFYQYYTCGDLPKMYRKGLLDYITEISETYGKHGDPVQIPFGPASMVVVSDPEDVQELLGKPDHVKKLSKGRPLKTLRDLFVGESTAFIDRGDQWKKLHNAMLPYFMQSGVNGYFETMVQKAQGLVNRMHEKAKVGKSKIVDVEREMLILGMEMISSNMLNADIPYEKLEGIHDAMTVIFHYIHNRNLYYPRYNVPLIIPTSPNREFNQAVRQVKALVNEIIENDAKLEKEGLGDNTMIRAFRKAHQNSLDPVLKGDESLLVLTGDRLVDQVLAVFVGGHETTAHLMALALYRMAEHPEIKDRLRQEIARELGDDPLTQTEQLKKMTYTSAFLNEVLRVDSPVSVIAREALEDIEIRGNKIPKKSLIVFSIHSTHRLEEFWKDPKEFNPDRFMPEIENIHHTCNQRHPKAFMPFGSGDRACIGKFFALQEAKILVIEWLRSALELEAIVDERIEPVITCTTKLKNGLPMVLRRR